jgi:hypothetical protein
MENISMRSLVCLALLIATIGAAGCNRRAPAGPPPDSKWAKDLRESFAGSHAPPPVSPMASGTATIRGVFKFKSGDELPPAKYLDDLVKKNNDRVLCLDGGNVDSGRLVISGDRGIANIMLYLRNGKKIGWAPGVEVPTEAIPLAKGLDSNAPENQVAFDQKACVFLTRNAAMRTGQTLKIINSDPVGHNTNIPGFGFNQSVPAMSFLTYVPPKEVSEPYSVSCSIHPWMSAWLLTRNDGFFAVTKPDGSFELKNLPAGVKLDIQVWHESAPGHRLDVEKTSDQAPTLVWKKGKKGRVFITLEPGQTVDLGTIEVPLDAFQLD